MALRILQAFTVLWWNTLLTRMQNCFVKKYVCAYVVKEVRRAHLIDKYCEYNLVLLLTPLSLPKVLHDNPRYRSAQSETDYSLPKILLFVSLLGRSFAAEDSKESPLPRCSSNTWTMSQSSVGAAYHRSGMSAQEW